MSYVMMIAVKPQRAVEGGLLAIANKYCKMVIQEGGIIRNVRNNGVRRMAYSFHQRGDSTRYNEVNHFCIEFFANSKVPDLVNLAATTDERLLRMTCLKANETMPIIPYSERLTLPKSKEAKRVESIINSR